MAHTVLITGANRGIGLALCQQYLKNGDQVIAVCRTASKALESIDVEIIDAIDVAKSDDIKKLQESLNGRSLDLLINNAGILRGDSLSDLSESDIVEQFTVNALAPLMVTQALQNNLKAGSKLALITSRMGSIEDNTSGSTYGYRMSKAALNAAGVSLAHDLKPKGVAVCLLHPGYVQTEMVNMGGEITPELAATRLCQRINELNLENSGSFWHSNGELLPW